MYKVYPIDIKWSFYHFYNSKASIKKKNFHACRYKLKRFIFDKSTYMSL